MEASIIIPTYNRAEKLRNCLDALSSQTQPVPDFEVVVVVDGSTDGTLEMLASLETPFALQVIRQPNAGQPAALNRGAAESTGRTCIFLDDDIVVTPRFVAEHLCLHHERELVVGIGQITLTLLPDADWFARGFAQSWLDHYAAFNQGRRQPDWDDCYGGNMSVSRAAFLAVGGNVTDLRRGYDVELAYRLKEYGCSFEYLPEALGNQQESKGFRELAADAELAGEGSVALARRHPATEMKLFRHFYENRRSWILLWRFLSITHTSARGMERLQRLAGRRGESFEWFAFFSNYYFWRGVRRAAPERTAWKQMLQLKKRGNFA
ncbi:MAG TPA: glycosyltransferase [Anaerolineales bacterium]|nr:glycosyltransferase [Anaerolineales bacterium]